MSGLFGPVGQWTVISFGSQCTHLAGKIEGWHSRTKDATRHLHLPTRANITRTSHEYGLPHKINNSCWKVRESGMEDMDIWPWAWAQAMRPSCAEDIASQDEPVDEAQERSTQARPVRSLMLLIGSPVCGGGPLGSNKKRDLV